MRSAAASLLAVFAVTLAACDEGAPQAPAASPTKAADDARMQDAGAPAAPKTALARLRGLKGPVSLERDQQKRPAAEEVLYAGDAVETGAEAEAQVHLEDGRIVELGPNALVVLGQDAEGLFLDVKSGLVLSRVPKPDAVAGASADGAPRRTPTVELRILTPFGLTRVGGGDSEVSVAVSEEAAKVDVLIGQVEWVARSGESTQAKAGESVSISAGKVEVLARQGDVLMLEPIQVTLVADGRAEIRKKGQKSWKSVGKRGALLEEGDAVRVRQGTSTLALGSEKSAITFAARSEALFKKVARSASGDHGEVELKTGAMDVRLARAKKSRIDVGGLALETDVGGDFRIVKTKDGFEVSALTGGATLQRGESKQEVVAGQTARVGARAAPSVTARDEPELVLPSRSGTRVYHPGLAAALIDWRGDDGEYLVRVGEDPRFDRLVLEGVVRRSQLAVNIPRRGTLYWEILDPATNKEIDSGSAVFAPEPRQTDLERVRNEVPEGPEKTTIYYQDKPPAVTFTYGTEPGAEKYRVAVFRVGQLDKPIAERTVAQTAAPLEAGVLAEGSYVWSVTPLATSGEPLRGGRMNKLDLVYDNSVASLLIRSPKNGDAAGSGLRTQGVAPVGSRLFINGKSVDLDEKSRFDVPVTAVGAKPVIIYRLSRSNAPDAFYVRALKRSRG